MVPRNWVRFVFWSVCLDRPRVQTLMGEWFKGFTSEDLTLPPCNDKTAESRKRVETIKAQMNSDLKDFSPHTFLFFSLDSNMTWLAVIGTRAGYWLRLTCGFNLQSDQVQTARRREGWWDGHGQSDSTTDKSPHSLLCVWWPQPSDLKWLKHKKPF